MKKKFIVIGLSVFFGFSLGITVSQFRYMSVPISDYIVAYLGCKERQREVAIMFHLKAAQGIEGAEETAAYWESRLGTEE